MRGRFLLLLLPPALALGIFAVTVGHGLIWDDVLMLPVLERGSAPGEVWDTLSRHLQFSPNYFRPLAVGTFMTEIRLGGGIRPPVHHAVAVALHTLNTALVVALAGSLLRDVPKRAHTAAVVAGVVYAVHPALVEGVAFVSCRFELLLTAFVLLALLADSHIRRGGLRAVTVAACFLLAAFSKETAAALALILPAWHLARLQVTTLSPRAAWRALRDAGHLRTYAAVGVAGVVYLVLRHLALGYLLTTEGVNPLDAGGFVSRVLLVGKTVGLYAGLTVWPFGSLSPVHWSELPVPGTDPAAWVSLVGIAAAAFLLPRAVRRAPRVTWLLVACAAGVLPVTNIVPLELGSGSYGAERFLMLPLAFAALAAGLVAARLARRSRAVLVGGWTVAAIAVSWTTLGHWSDTIPFWTWAAERAPRTATPWVSLSLEASNAKDYVLAEAHARHAVDVNPQADRAYTNLGHALINQDRVEEARVMFEKSLEIQPDNPLVWSNLARTLMELGEPREAERLLREEALRLDPGHPLALLNLGELHLRETRPDLALDLLRRSLRRLPDRDRPYVDMLFARCKEPNRWLDLAKLQMERGNTDASLAALDEAAARGAPSGDVAFGRAFALHGADRTDEALAGLETALRRLPRDARLHNLLGEIARSAGDLPRAGSAFRKAVDLAPRWSLPRKNLDDLGE